MLQRICFIWFHLLLFFHTTYYRILILILIFFHVSGVSTDHITTRNFVEQDTVDEDDSDTATEVQTYKFVPAQNLFGDRKIVKFRSVHKSS